MTTDNVIVAPQLMRKMLDNFDKFCCMMCDEMKPVEQGMRKVLNPHIDVYMCSSCIIKYDDDDVFKHLLKYLHVKDGEESSIVAEAMAKQLLKEGI